jgi:predicted metal-dependent HD superfamily phosphohydrolase
MQYREVEKYVFRILATELEDNLYYHDLKHTADVIRAAERLCFMENVSEHDAMLVKTAALFHDVGFTRQYLENEDIAAEIAEEVLSKFDYSSKDIQTIKEIINVTKIPHNPANHLQEIMCDADLDYLGREDFPPISDALMRELMGQNMIKTAKEWDGIQVKFFKLHKYFTPSAINLRSARKEQHLQVIIDRLNRYD